MLTKSGFENGPQEDQRVRFQEIVEGTLQETLWTRFADQIRSGLFFFFLMDFIHILLLDLQH